MKTTHLYPCLCVLLFLSESLLAATFSFTGSVNGQWTEAGNWQPGYPGLTISEGDQININADCSLFASQVINNGGILISAGAKLTLNSGARITNNNNVEAYGQLQVLTGSQFVNNISSVVHPGASLIINGQWVNENGLLQNGGAITNMGQFQNSSSGQLIHLATATFDNNTTLINYGTVLVNGPGFDNHATVQNHGDWAVSGTMMINGDMHNNGSLSVTGSVIVTAGGSLLNHGLLDITRSGDVSSDGIFNNFTLGEILNSGELVCLETGLLINEGNMTTYVGSTFDNYGFVTNEGPIMHSGSFENFGALQTFSLIHNAGAIDNRGIFTVETAGDLQMKSGSHFVSYHEGVLTIR